MRQMSTESIELFFFFTCAFIYFIFSATVTIIVIVVGGDVFQFYLFIYLNYLFVFFANRTTNKQQHTQKKIKIIVQTLGT